MKKDKCQFGIQVVTKYVTQMFVILGFTLSYPFILFQVSYHFLTCPVGLPGMIDIGEQKHRIRSDLNPHLNEGCCNFYAFNIPYP
jgi:hypothetical protein